MSSAGVSQTSEFWKKLGGLLLTHPCPSQEGIIGQNRKSKIAVVPTLLILWWFYYPPVQQNSQQLGR